MILYRVVQMDYTFYRRRANQHRIEGESTLVTVLKSLFMTTDLPFFGK